jgi:hypothetical protein
MADGLYMIRQPLAGSGIQQDITNPNLLAWSQDDEPDVNGTAASVLAANYAAWKKVDPNRPVFVNFSGGNVLNNLSASNKAFFQSYMASGDWVSNDIYPVTGYNRPDWIDYSKNPTDRKTPGIAINQLRSWSGGKSQYAFIETSDQNLAWTPSSTRGVTADEFRGEVWDAIINGARGIFYFPQAFNGFTQDATPAAVVTSMVKQNKLITSLGAVINSGSTSDPQKLTLSSPTLEGTWRQYNGQEYFLVLNMSSTTVTATMSLPGLSSGELLDVFDESRGLVAAGSSITDTFQPDQLHVYEVQSGSVPPGVSVTPVPEPSSLAALATVATLSLRRRRRRT